MSDSVTTNSSSAPVRNYHIQCFILYPHTAIQLILHPVLVTSLGNELKVPMKTVPRKHCVRAPDRQGESTGIDSQPNRSHLAKMDITEDDSVCGIDRCCFTDIANRRHIRFQDNTLEFSLNRASAADNGEQQGSNSTESCTDSLRLPTVASVPNASGTEVLQIVPQKTQHLQFSTSTCPPRKSC